MPRKRRLRRIGRKDKRERYENKIAPIASSDNVSIPAASSSISLFSPIQHSVNTVDIDKLQTEVSTSPSTFTATTSKLLQTNSETQHTISTLVPPNLLTNSTGPSVNDVDINDLQRIAPTRQTTSTTDSQSLQSFPETLHTRATGTESSVDKLPKKPKRKMPSFNNQKRITNCN